MKAIIVNNNEISDNAEIAEHFNNYFADIANTLDSTIPTTIDSPYQSLTQNHQASVFFRSVTAAEVCEITAKLKNTASNINEIPVAIFKRIRNVLSEPISMLMNTSISRGVFPQCLKNANIIQIFKKGDTQNMSNYRPIALLPTLSKIFERCIADRLTDFLYKSEAIYAQQFGFVKGRSTTHVFIVFTEYIFSCLNRREHCIGVFLDLTKAFDTVNQEVLLGELERYGVRRLPLQWLASYLRDRQQRVSISGRYSSHRTVNVGIPLESIMGPILFFLYMNDLPKISSDLLSILYADDTTLLSSHSEYSTLIQRINDELPKVRQWTIANRLSVNLDKIYAMMFTNRERAIPTRGNIYFNDTLVKFKTDEDFLGLIINNLCKFIRHVDYVCKKILKTIGIIYKLNVLVPQKILIS